MPNEDFTSVQWLKMIKKVLDVTFNLSSSVYSWERALSIMSTTEYRLDPIITHRVSIENWEEAFKYIADGNAIKVLFVPDIK